MGFQQFTFDTFSGKSKVNPLRAKQQMTKFTSAKSKNKNVSMLYHTDVSNIRGQTILTLIRRRIIMQI